MMNYKHIRKILAGGLISFSLLTSTVIAVDAPTELTADTIEYNSTSDIATASGGVKIIRDGGTLTGNQATYNFKTQQASLTGGVNLVKGDLKMVSQQIVANADHNIIADGSVVVTKADNVLRGPKVVYNQVNQNISMPQGGLVNGPKVEIRANSLSGNIDSQRYNANGNVFLHSKTNDFTATSNTATYTAAGAGFNFTASGNVNISSPSRNLTSHSNQASYNSGDNGRLILSGNAVAKQQNNTIRGNTLTVYLGDNIKIQ